MCGLVLWARDFHLPLALRRNDMRAIQAAHTQPTPRLGGLALLAGLFLSSLLVSDEIAPRFRLFLFSLAPVFVAGLLEDIGIHVSPRLRLGAAALSSVIVIALLDVWIPRVGVPLADRLFALAPLAIPFTVFACVGVSNAFNLIDGLNGLSSGVGVVVALALAAIAAKGGSAVLVECCLLVAAALVGFLLFNFPLGLIFLGDAGAYTLGHVLAWFSVSLMVRVPEVTPWAVLLVFFWPIADTFMTILRRRRARRAAMHPDRMHFHQALMRGLEIVVLGRRARRFSNPMTTVLMVPLFSAPAVVGVILWNEPVGAFVALCCFAVLFTCLYQTSIRYARGHRRRLVRLRAQRGAGPDFAPVPVRKAGKDG